jgi:hypothetical protein
MHVPLPGEYGLEIFRCQVGSGLHGVTVASQDDRDEMGICVEHPDYVLGIKKVLRKNSLRKFEQYEYRTQPEGSRSGPGDLDLVVYSLRKWMRLAISGNPTVLLPMFAPPTELAIESDYWLPIHAERHNFVSQSSGFRFLGYMQDQRARMLGLTPKRTNRPELEAMHGFDTKFAYHMIRLGIQGIEFLTTGEITLPMAQPERGRLIGLRRGLLPKEECLEWALLLELEIERIIPTLPERANIDANGLLRRTYLAVWRDLEVLT